MLYLLQAIVLLIVFSLIPQGLEAAGKPKTPDNATARQLSDMVKESSLTLEQAVGRGLEKVAGKAVQVELQKKDNKTVWEVTILKDDGKLERVYVDGKDGSYLVPVFSSHGRQSPPNR